jgi:hypothetical protein
VRRVWGQRVRTQTCPLSLSAQNRTPLFYAMSGGLNLRRIINLSVVIVRACGRSSNHEKSGFGTAVPQRALRRLLDAPLEAGHDNPRGRRGKLKLARIGLGPCMNPLAKRMDCRAKPGNDNRFK